MEYLFDLSLRFFHFLSDELVPFMTEPIDELTFLGYNLVSSEWEYFSIPWPFPNTSFGEFILISGLTFFLGYRFVKFFIDIFG